MILNHCLQVAHSTRSTLEESIENAISEACRAAHATLRREYWNDSKKLKDGILGKVNPGAHSVYYAYHEPFPNFLFGSPVSWNIANKSWNQRIQEVMRRNEEFLFEIVLSGELNIGFSVHPSFSKLTWGLSSSEFNLKNVKPHFVA